MSAWTQLIEPGPALLILVLALIPQLGYAAPSGPSASSENSDQSTEIEYYPVADATGCYYNFEHYDEGDRIITNEPCLNCTCHNRMLMCYLRVCPFTKAIGQDCKMEKKIDQCCPVITCPEVHVELLSHASTTASTQVGHPNEYGCSIENLFYADGAKVPSNPNNPCEVCYCIRNKTACIIQECTLTGKVVEGCRPVYVDGVCCPVRYDCDHPEIETTPRPLLTTTTTTLPPTSAPTDCIYNNEVYADGALVNREVPCEQCYCMRGDIVCAVQECGPTPLDKINCTALPIKEGQCCPDTYECENLSEEDLTTLSYYDAPTTLPTAIEEEVGATTKAPIPQITLAEDQQSAETEGRVRESTTEIIGDYTVPDEGSVTESTTVEVFTSKISDAVEAVTSKVTEIIEAVTSTITGSEKNTSSSPETIIVDGKPEAITTEAVVTEKSEQITEKSAEGQAAVTEYEGQTDHDVVVTEGIVQETQTPESDDQKLAVTTTGEIEHIPVTTEIAEQDVATELGEPVAHDDHEDTEHEDENEVTEGTGVPAGEKEQSTTHTPESDMEDKHTRPIDRGEIEEQTPTTERSEVEITNLPTEGIPHEDEHQITEGSGEEEPISTLTPESVTIDHGQVTEQSEVKGTGEPEISSGTTETLVEEHTKTISEESVTSEPVTPSGTEQPGEEQISPEYCSGESCQQTVQPLEAAITTANPEISVVETTITEQEQPHADITKQPGVSVVTEEIETKLPVEITTTENIISESIKPDISMEEEKTSEPKETTTVVPSDQEPISEEKEPIEGVTRESPSVTETIPTTETEKTEVEVAHEEEKPSLDGTEEKYDNATTEKEEIQFVTEIPTRETKKPQSMDHVFETVSPDFTTIKPDSEVHETEKSVEIQTTEKNVYTTELPKTSITLQPDTIKPEPGHPVEAVTELSGSRAEITTENIPEVTEAVTSVPEILPCDSEYGCAPGQQENNEIPGVVELCTKESCAPQEHKPQAEDGKETGTVPKIPTSCDSEHGCVPTEEKEGTKETKLPEEGAPIECYGKDGCLAPGSEKEGHIPEITEGEVKVPEGEEKDTLPEVTTISDEIITTVPQKVTSLYEDEQPQTVSESTVKPEEVEESGQDIEGSGQKPEDVQHTEGSGEGIEGSGHVTTEESKPVQITEEGITHTIEPIEQDATKATPSLSEAQTDKTIEKEQIVTVTPIAYLENEIEAESTTGYKQTEHEKSQTPGVTESPEFDAAGTQTPETFAPQGTQVPEITVHEGTESLEEITPEVTKASQDTATEGEILGPTEVPAFVVPEITQTPENTETEVTDSTVIPEILSSTQGEAENELFPESTQIPEHTELEETRSPYENIPVSTDTSKQEVTQSPEKDVTSVTEIPEEIVTARTQYPENVISGSTELPEEVPKDTADNTTSEHVAPGDTKVPVKTSPVFASKPNRVIIVTTDSIQEAPTESTRIPADVVPESTESPGEIDIEAMEGPEDAVPQTTQHIQDISTGSTSIPELSSSTQSSEEAVPQQTQTPAEIVPETTVATEGIHDSTQEPEQISSESTVSSIDLGIEKTETPETTDVPEKIIPESTYTPEILPTEQVTSEGTHAPEQVPSEEIKTSEPEISQSTQSPDEISGTTYTPENIPQTTQASDYRVSETETTETSEQTQHPEKVPEGTELPERIATGVPEFPEAPVQVTTETEIEEEEHGIPGEGNCLVDGQTYKNNSNVPPINQCQTSCKCVSSILQCESVSCRPPPNNLEDCIPIFHSPDSCCPIYSCSVPGVTSMESDSHVVETTTVVQEEEKPVTIGIQIVSSEEVTDKSTGVSISSEEATTTKHVEKETDAPEIIETSDVSVHEPTTTKSVEKDSTIPEISEPPTTDKIESETEILPEVDTDVSVVETITKESAVPESQTGIPGEEITDAITEISEAITTEQSARPAKPVEGEQHPEQDETENEIDEIPIIPEHCGGVDCQVSVGPTKESQLPEIPVTTAPEGEIEHTESSTEQEATERHKEHYTSEPSVELTEETPTEVTKPSVGSELSTSEIPTATDQIATEVPSEETSTHQKLPESPSSTVTDQPEKEPSTSETESPKISEEGATIPEYYQTKLPDSVTEAITESKPFDEEYIPSGNETSVTEKVHGELTTESEDISEFVTETISQETISPEEIAAIPEKEEAVTSLSVLPESVTKTAIEETTQFEKLPGDVKTEQPTIVDEVAPETEIPVESEITTKAQELSTKPGVEIESTEGVTEHDEESTESQPEIRYPDRVSTAKPDNNLQTTEPHVSLQTTSPILEHVTELDELITPKPIEAADHVTEKVEEESEKTVTPIIEISAESTSKQSVEEPDHIAEVVTTSVPQEENKPEGESAAESHLTTSPTPEEETGIVTTSESKPSATEFTTISAEIGEVTQPTLQEKETEKEGPITPVTEGGVTLAKEHEVSVTEKEEDVTQLEEGEFPTHAPIDKETEADHVPSVTEKESVTIAYVTTEIQTVEPVKLETEPVVSTEKVEEGVYTSPQLTTQAPSNDSALYTSGFEEISTKKSVAGELSTSATAAAPVSTVGPSTSAPSYVPPPIPGHEIPGEQVPEIPDYQSPGDDYEDEDQSPLGPGTCRYGGKVYVSAQQIPRDDPCDFCFCFRSDIICLQQSCPPPIPRCHEEPIRGFCCPRYECPVGMATAVNVTTSTTTTTTTLPPHFFSHAYEGRVMRSGCQIKGRAYQVGDEITSASGPCLHCTCGGDGEMKCDPKPCSPEPMLRQMIAAAASRRRR